VRAALFESDGAGAFAALRSYVVGSAGTTAVPPSLRAVLQPLLAARVTVETLASDPFTVCWEGAHVSVASGAAAVLALFSIGFPLLTAIVVAAVLDMRMRNPRIVGPLSSTRWRAFGGIRSICCQLPAWARARATRSKTSVLTSTPSMRIDETGETGVHQLNPLRGAPPSSPSSGGAKKPADAQSAAALLDASPEASQFRMVSTWVFENTKPSLFFLPLLNNVFLLVLAVTVAYQLGTSASVLSTTAEQLRRSLLVWGVAVVVAIAGAAMHFKLERFTGTDRWRNSAVASIYLLMGLGNTVNLSVALRRNTAPTPPPRATRTLTPPAPALPDRPVKVRLPRVAQRAERRSRDHRDGGGASPGRHGTLARARRVLFPLAQRGRCRRAQRGGGGQGSTSDG
jgi:hypothetical protein